MATPPDPTPVWDPRKPRRKLRPYREQRPVDIERLHRYLWSLIGPNQRLRITQVEVSSRLQIDNSLVSVAMKKMEREGRLRRVGRAQRTLIYQVANPTTWQADDPETHAQARQVIQWG